MRKRGKISKRRKECETEEVYNEDKKEGKVSRGRSAGTDDQKETGILVQHPVLQTVSEIF